MNKTNFATTLTVTCFSIAVLPSLIQAESVPEELLGFWSLNLESGEPAWLKISEEEQQPIVHMRIYIGPDGPYALTDITDERIKFSLKPKRKTKGSKIYIDQDVEVGITNGKLDGVLIRTPNNGSDAERIPFTGKRVPARTKSAPDLSKVKFGHPISLFNGKDLTGWRPYESDKINGWSVQDGMLVNTTEKTDFSPTGDHANLRTEAEFEDFWLHIEFLIEENRNSGIYLRGMYEAQVVDRGSRMQGLQGVGAIFGRIAPSIQAGNPGGKWQTYDLTLVDRHITVVLNGVKVIDNQPIDGPTAGAIYTNPSAPGPIYLQGDHTSVKFKNIYLAPVISSP